jgi:hypothetical protein
MLSNVLVPAVVVGTRAVRQGDAMERAHPSEVRHAGDEGEIGGYDM